MKSILMKLESSALKGQNDIMMGIAHHETHHQLETHRPS
jgi:hypothetical protein